MESLGVSCCTCQVRWLSSFQDSCLQPPSCRRTAGIIDVTATRVVGFESLYLGLHYRASSVSLTEPSPQSFLPEFSQYMQSSVPRWFHHAASSSWTWRLLALPLKTIQALASEAAKTKQHGTPNLSGVCFFFFFLREA